MYKTQEVEIEFVQPDSFQVSAFDSDGSLLLSDTLSESKGHFRCGENGVEFRSGWKGYGGDTMGATGMGRRVFTFNKGVDGSLVVHRNQFQAGAIVVVPYAGSGNNWSLWPLLTHDQPGE